MNGSDITETSKGKDVKVEDDGTKTSQLKCFVNLLKGNVGTGILALPMAFKNAGIWVGITGNIFLGFTALHCMHLLVQCNDTARKRTNCGPLGYAEVAETCFATGPKNVQKFKNAASIFVNVFIIAISLGACSIYIVFIADNLRQVINSSDALDPTLDKIIMGCEVIVMILFCTLVQSLKGLAYLSMMANVLQISGLCIIMANVLTDLPNVDVRPAVGSLKTLPLYFGTAVYSFEGIALVLPLKNKVRDEHDFGRPCGLLTLGWTIVIALYITVGFFGYLKFGDHILGSITLNIPAKGWLWKSTKIMFVLAITVTYGVIFYVPMSVMFPAVEVHLKTDNQRCLVNIAMRVGLVIFTCIVAIVVPDLGLLISLIGALTGAALQFIFPPIIHIVTLSADGEKLRRSTVVKDILIFLMGLTGMLTGTYTSLSAIVNTM